MHASMAALQARCFSLRQLLTAVLYLFWFLLFLGLPNSWITLGDGPTLPIIEIESSFNLQFIFAANVLFLFVVLHLLQWIVSSRLQTCRQRLGV